MSSERANSRASPGSCWPNGAVAGPTYCSCRLTAPKPAACSRPAPPRKVNDVGGHSITRYPPNRPTPRGGPGVELRRRRHRGGLVQLDRRHDRERRRRGHYHHTGRGKGDSVGSERSLRRPVAGWNQQLRQPPAERRHRNRGHPTQRDNEGRPSTLTLNPRRPSPQASSASNRLTAASG